MSDKDGSDFLRAAAEARVGAALLAGVCGGLSSVLDQAETAAGIGYDAVMLHDPVDPFAFDAGLAVHVNAVADASPLPVVAYVRSARWHHKTLTDVVAHPNVIAVRYAVPQVAAVMQHMLDADLRDGCVWICGAAEAMVPTFAGLGVTAFTSGLANVRPDLALALWTAIREGDWEGTRAVLAHILPFEHLRIRDGGRHNVAIVKEALAHVGCHVGGVRPPCVPLDHEARACLRHILEIWDSMPMEEPAPRAAAVTGAPGSP